MSTQPMEQDGPVAPLAAGAAPVKSYTFKGATFELPPRYVPVRHMGQGATGIVLAALDTHTNQHVAIKKISNAFQDLRDTKRVVREIKLLRHFKHENVLSIRDILPPPRNRAEFEDVYIVSELMETDLQHIITSDQVLSNDHCQFFLYQLLCALKAIHSGHVLHRDLKPGNLLTNADCHLKVCDFGLARVANVDNNWNGFLTGYVTTRWYRAPEVILSWKQYTKAVDVWSVGCIFAELLSPTPRQPLFKGTGYIDQLAKITDILGSPPEDEINAIQNEQARLHIRGMGHKPKVPFAHFIRAPPAALDLLERMLAFDPTKRCTVEQALEHPYFASIRDRDEETTSDSVFNFDFEDLELNKADYQDLIVREVLHFHPEVASYWEPAPC